MTPPKDLCISSGLIFLITGFNILSLISLVLPASDLGNSGLWHSSLVIHSTSLSLFQQLADGQDHLQLFESKLWLLQHGKSSTLPKNSFLQTFQVQIRSA